MGSAVCQAVAGDPALDLGAAVDPHHGGLDVRQVAKCESNLQVATEADAFIQAGVQVAVDFTSIDAARQNLRWCAEQGVHAVVGTSGFTEDDHDEIRSMFARSNCVIAPNFAIGAVLMMRFAELAAPFSETAEIIELHHDTKIDAPSGTAVSTAERMAAASAVWAPDPVKIETIEGARG